MDDQNRKIEATSALRELSLAEINMVGGGGWLKLVWRFVNLYLLHPSHTDKDPNKN